MINKIKERIIYGAKFIEDGLIYNLHKKPKVLNCNETIDKIINERCSMSRFGDGEFFLLLKNREFAFQNINEDLSNKLKVILASNEKGLIIGIPDVFSKNSLQKRTNKSKEWWKRYLLYNRRIWYKYIDFNKIYGDTNFTRNYLGIKDKSCSSDYFKKIKQIWKKRDILIIEGKYSRVGVGNDLFESAKSIVRILAPSKNAFDKYNILLNEATKQSKDMLVLIALGPTATVLSYDLHRLGYQAIDIGHIDIEYEWYLRRAKEKIALHNKSVFEANGIIENDEFYDELYQQQIIKEIL